MDSSCSCPGIPADSSGMFCFALSFKLNFDLISMRCGCTALCCLKSPWQVDVYSDCSTMSQLQTPSIDLVSDGVHGSGDNVFSGVLLCCTDSPQDQLRI